MDDLVRDIAPPWAKDLLAKFGMNRHGEPRYRVAWAPYRVRIIGGTWHDGTERYSRVRCYMQVRSWVLERHRPNCWYGPPETWPVTESGYLPIGPYPERGRYDLVYAFRGGDFLSHAFLLMLVRLDVFRRYDSVEEIESRNREEYDSEESAKQERIDEIWAESRMSRQQMTFGQGVSYSPDAARERKRLELRTMIEQMECRRVPTGFQSGKELANAQHIQAGRSQ